MLFVPPSSLSGGRKYFVPLAVGHLDLVWTLSCGPRPSYCNWRHVFWPGLDFVDVYALDFVCLYPTNQLLPSLSADVLKLESLFVFIVDKIRVYVDIGDVWLGIENIEELEEFNRRTNVAEVLDRDGLKSWVETDPGDEFGEARATVVVVDYPFRIIFYFDDIDAVCLGEDFERRGSLAGDGANKTAVLDQSLASVGGQRVVEVFPLTVLGCWNRPVLQMTGMILVSSTYFLCFSNEFPP